MLITSLHFYDSIFIKWTDSAWLHRPWRTSRTQRPSTTQHWGSGAPADPGRPRVQGFKRSEGSEVFLKCAIQWRKGRKCVLRTPHQAANGRGPSMTEMLVKDPGLRPLRQPQLHQKCMWPVVTTMAKTSKHWYMMWLCCACSEVRT